MRAAALVAILSVTSLAGCVLLMPPSLEQRPRWRVTGDAGWEAGCVAARAFVRKSGKAGFGLAIQLRSRTSCRVQLASGHLVFARGGDVVIPPDAVVDMRGRSLLYAWLPVRFDNDAAWNEGRVVAGLELRFTVDGIAAPPWRIAVAQGPP